MSNPTDRICPDCQGPKSPPAARCRGCHNLNWHVERGYLPCDCGGWRRPRFEVCYDCWRAGVQAVNQEITMDQAVSQLLAEATRIVTVAAAEDAVVEAARDLADLTVVRNTNPGDKTIILARARAIKRKSETVRAARAAGITPERLRERLREARAAWTASRGDA